MTRKKIHSIFIIITSFIIISIISLYLLSKIQEKDKSNYGYSGSTEEGMERLNKYIEQHPKNTEAMIDLARKYLNIREYEKAGDLLIQIIQTDPNHEMALYTYGRLFVEQFKFSEAIEQFEKVVAINENPIASLQYLTHIYLVFDRQKALEYAKKATDIQRQRYEQGEEDVNIPFFEEWENIVAEFDTKFEIDPAAATLEMLEHLFDSSIQLELCKNVLKSNNPSNPQKMQELLERMGMLYTEVGMHEEAIDTYKTLIETTPTYGRGYILLADRSIKTNNLTLIDELYDDIQKQQGLEIEKDIIDALVQYKRGRTDETLESLQKIQSNDYEIILEHITGMLYENLGDKENALAAYHRVSSYKCEENADLYYYYAISYDVDKAISSLKP